MSVIEELIRQEKNGTISFGNYLLDSKKKVLDFEVKGDLYKVKTFQEITKLEKNGKMILEAVPGATIHNFDMTEKGVSFVVEAKEDLQLTLELEPDVEYKILVDNVNVGRINTNMTGKVNFSIEMQENITKTVEIKKM
ncbi:MAG TPA: endosialidase [Candidatus Coprocola pullicola]|nr:endosialidase [Candidatus Coprocola pullicola]